MAPFYRSHTIFVFISLFAATHSVLGNEISAAESAGFAWISANIIAELDLLQLFNTVKDPMEKNNLLQEEPELAAEMEKELLAYLEKVEGKTYRPLFPRNLLNQHLLIFSNCER